MTRIKLNYFFFIWTIIMPITMATVAVIIYWPWLHLRYVLIIAPMWFHITVFYVFGFLFFGGIAVYLAIPWVAVIRNDRIVFHRLFRRKLEVNLKEVKEVEIISKKLPVESNPWGVGNVIFRKANGDYILVAGISNSSLKLIKDLAENNGIAVYEVNRQLTQEEKHKID